MLKFGLKIIAEMDDESSTKTLTRPKLKVTRPPMYNVVLLNDDFTPMDFVIHILKKFFSKSDAEAAEIMLQVHHKGAGLAGTYSFDMAETKVELVNQYSQENQHPLKCSLSKE